MIAWFSLSLFKYMHITFVILLGLCLYGCNPTPPQFLAVNPGQFKSIMKRTTGIGENFYYCGSKNGRAYFVESFLQPFGAIRYESYRVDDSIRDWISLPAKPFDEEPESWQNISNIAHPEFYW